MPPAPPTDPSSNDSDDTSTDRVFAPCTFDRLQQLQPGDEVTVRYMSVYSFTEKTLHGTVTRNEAATESPPEELVVFINPDTDEETDTESESHTAPRRIHGINDLTGDRCIVETLSRNKWDRLSVTPKPEIAEGSSSETS